MLIFFSFFPIILFVRGFAPNYICGAGSRLLRKGKAVKVVEGRGKGKKTKANNPFLSAGLLGRERIERITATSPQFPPPSFGFFGFLAEFWI